MSGCGPWAQSRLSGQNPGASVNTTHRVHEAYPRLVDQSRAEWNDRAHFFAVAATAMRQIIVDRARRRRAGKRGGAVRPGLLDDAALGTDARTEEILALDQALTQLGSLSPRMVKMVELRFFAGLSIEETAEVLGLDPRTLNRDWRAELEALLAADSEAGAFLGAPVDVTLLAPAPGEGAEPSLDTTRLAGTLIGSYKVVREIGRGGMGVIYEAEQQRPRPGEFRKIVAGRRGPFDSLRPRKASGGPGRPHPNGGPR